MSLLDDEKKFYERFWALLNNNDLMRIFKKHGAAAFRRSSVLEGFDAFIKENNFTGDTCVEIGTLKGLTAIILARHFKRVVSIDIIDDPQKREFVQMLGIKNIEFVNVADNAEKARVINALQFDAAYVDGDHKHDTETDFALVRRGGRALFHEHWDCQPAVVNQVRQLGGTVVKRDKWALWTA